MTKFHPYHIVDVSPWPVLISMSTGSLMVNTYVYMQKSGSGWVVVFSLLGTMGIAYMWWRDVVRESTYQGNHTIEVYKGLVWGMILFITSEVMFFFSFFFSYFFISLNPSVEVGSVWPPVGIESINYMSIPFVNTLLLLSSGVSITWAHHSLMGDSKSQVMIGLMVTVSLGLIFFILQMLEYYESSFTMSDSSYGSMFYLMTGFHGIHVVLGVIFSLITTVRVSINHMSKYHHWGFESSAWYWHFVDVVWLFLFVTVYYWGS